jgi:hypothetical protein
VWRTPKWSVARLGQFQSVDLRLGERLFVGVDIPLTEFAQPDTAHETATQDRLPVVIELLVVNVDRGIRVALQNPFPLPPVEEVCGPAVLFVFAIGRFGAIQDHADHVRRVLGIESVLQGRVDDVVRGGDHVRELADLGEVIPESGEWGDDGHVEAA